MKSDDVGVQTVKAAIAGVNMFVEVMVICVVVVFSIFLAYAMVGRNEKVRHVVSVLVRCCSSSGSTTEEAGTSGHEDENVGKKRRCNYVRRCKRNRRLNRGGDDGGRGSGDGGGEGKDNSDGGAEAAASSVELVTVGGASAADVEDTEPAVGDSEEVSVSSVAFSHDYGENDSVSSESSVPSTHSSVATMVGTANHEKLENLV